MQVKLQPHDPYWIFYKNNFSTKHGKKREYFVKNFSMKTLHLFHVINQTEREQNEDKKESELRKN